MTDADDAIDDVLFDEHLAHIANMPRRRKRELLRDIDRRDQQQRVTPRAKRTVLNVSVWQVLADMKP